MHIDAIANQLWMLHMNVPGLRFSVPFKVFQDNNAYRHQRSILFVSLYICALASLPPLDKIPASCRYFCLQIWHRTSD